MLGPQSRSVGRRGGMTLVEVSISAAIMAVVLTAMIVGMQRETRGLSNIVTTTTRERQAHEMVARIENELEYAAAAMPTAFLQAAAGPTSAGVVLDNSAGFPPSGIALVAPGGASQGLYTYSTLTPGTHTLGGLQFTEDCAQPPNASVGASVLWGGAAFAIPNQASPPANQYDGTAVGITGPVFFRGTGTGFGFRVPTDPTGGDNFFDAAGVTWGSEVAGTPTLDGWSAFDFDPVDQISEAELSLDINLDGDQLDNFDVGRLRLRTWDVNNVGGGRDTSLGPAMVLQERCNYGSDMDGDGFEDPIFLWNEVDQTVTISLTVHAGFLNEVPVIRRVQTTVFLRNGSAN